MLRLLAPAALALASTAGATELSWQWTEGVERSYYVESVLLYNIPVLVNGERNIEIRLGQMELKFLTTCTSVPENKRRWEHTCVIDDIGLLASAWTERENERLPELLEELDDKLTGASVQIRQRTNGRVVGFDLQGVAKNNREVAHTHTVLRNMLRQSFSGLDLEFTSYATDDIWVQPSSRMVELAGSFGSVPIAHKIADSSQERSVITSYGRGSIGRDESSGYDVHVSGDTLWDNAQGAFLYRSWKVLAKERMAVGERPPLANTGWMAALGEGEDRPSVGVTGLWFDHAVRDTAITLMDVLLTRSPL